ncbi:zinc finger protein ZAT9 [Benincasa hispida]|uniref:zinc finger protein ZAT9 n=1 Tax=Benincasa hispida TaxID=102211 RepID=UPI0019000AF4|nr:zinc finger protein ZAT9 [Benincasa hispida]
MESHKCKLCTRAFTNGRALGGHMKAHLTAAAALPFTPPKPPSSSSSSFAADDDDLQFPPEDKPTLYELRENPKKNFRFSDPVFNIVLQDRESETESKNPTRKRSKRWRKQPLTEAEPASSVSDASPEEDLALCLMMLSRDQWIKNQNQKRSFEELGSKIKVKKGIRRKKKCEKCKKQFRSYRALFSHEKICQLETEQEQEQEQEESLKNDGNRRIFKCPFCYKLFGSGQALGGHKRSHLVSSTNASVSLKLQISLIDLNLPAPLEEDDYSVVSEA